ncbi:MAG: general secretion pathway protein GspB [Desulfobacterium sp.]|nr:general secretion pathway protein GspB [Desulfobacterium sp.]
MSTILDALKKLEQESRAEETQHPPALNIHLRQERNLWKEKHSWAVKGRTPLLWAILSTLLLLGAFALFALITGRFQGKMPPTAIKPMAPPMQLPLVKEMATPPKATPLMEHTPPVQERMIPPAAPPAKPVEPPPREKGKADKPEIKAEEPHRPHPDTVVTREERVQAPDKEIRLLGDGILKINAISWSQQADERLAVINSTIVREGQTVEGFRLVRILEDGVIVHRAGQKSRVEFRLR